MARREQDVPGDTIQSILEGYGLLGEEDEEERAGPAGPRPPSPTQDERGTAVDTIIDKYGLRPDTTEAPPPEEPEGTPGEPVGIMQGPIRAGRFLAEEIASAFRGPEEEPERPSPGDLPDTAATRREVADAYGNPPPESAEKRRLREEAVVQGAEAPTEEPTVRGDSEIMDRLVDVSTAPFQLPGQPEERDYSAGQLAKHGTGVGLQLLKQGAGWLAEETGEAIGFKPGASKALEEYGSKLFHEARADLDRLQAGDQPHTSFGKGFEALMEEGDPEPLADAAIHTTFQMLPISLPAIGFGAVSSVGAGAAGLGALGQTVVGILGAGASVYPTEVGALKSDLMDQGLDEQAAEEWAEIGGYPIALAEGILEGRLGRQFPGTRAVRKAFVERLVKIAKESGKGSLTEGPTELLQELLGIGTEYAATGEIPDSDEIIRRGLEATAGGAVGGGVLGGGMNVVTQGVPAISDLRLPDVSEYSDEELMELLSNAALTEDKRTARAVQLEAERRMKEQSAEDVSDEPGVIERAKNAAVRFLGGVPQAEAEAQVEEARSEAETDVLTGLANRRGEERAKERREQPENTERHTFKADLANFKTVNDELGHDVGDETLVDVARILQQVTRDEDVVVHSRAGGDEFNIVLDIPEGQDPAAVRDRIMEEARARIAELPVQDELHIPIGIDIGVTDEDLREIKESEGSVSMDRQEREQILRDEGILAEEEAEEPTGAVEEEREAPPPTEAPEAPETAAEEPERIASDLEQELQTIDLKRPLEEFSDEDLGYIRRNVENRMRAADDVAPFEEDLRRIENIQRVRRGEKPIPPEGATTAAPRTELPDEVPARGEIEGVQGTETTIKAPDGTTLEARYRAVPISSLVGSHNPYTFAQNPAYPEAVQDRRYHEDRSAQERIVSIEARFDPQEYLDPTIQAAAGPTVVRPDGVILGGFNRYAALARMLRNRPEKAVEYLEAQQDMAERFGLDPEALAGTEEPHVIVREITDESVSLESREEMAGLSAKFNDPVSKARDAIGDAAVRARRLEQNTKPLEFFFENIGEEQTLRAFMDTASGREFVQMLVGHGIITENESGQFFDKNQNITGAAKEFVERLVDAAVITDPEILARAPRSYRRQVQKSAPAILQAAQVDGWDVRPEIMQAMELLARVRQNEALESLDDLLQQESMFAEERDPMAVTLAHFLEDEGQVNTRKAFVAWAADATEAQRIMDLRQAGDLFGDPPPLPDPAAAFARRFSERDWEIDEGTVPPGLEGGAHALAEGPDLFEAGQEGDFLTRPGRDLEDVGDRELLRLASDLEQRLQEAGGPFDPEPLAEGERRRINHDIRLADREFSSRSRGYNDPDHPLLPTTGLESVRFRTAEAEQLAREAGLDREHFEAAYVEGLRPGGFDGWPAEKVRAIVDLVENQDIEGFAGEVLAQEVQEDMFGGAAPAEGGDQFTMFPGTNRSRQKQGLTEAEREAAEIVSRLGEARESRQLSREELERLVQARKLLRRSEKFTSDEIRDMVGMADLPNTPQARGQMDAFRTNREQVEQDRHNVEPVNETDPDYPIHELRATLPDARRGNVETAGPGVELPEVTSRHEIIESLKELLHVPIRTGKARFGRSVRGIFKPQPEAIRLKYAQDVEAAAHEVGHYLQLLLFGDQARTKSGNLSKKPLQPWADELVPLSERIGSQTGVREGHAEFTRLYLTNRERAKELAPEYYDFVDSTLRKAWPDIHKGFEKQNERYEELQDAPAEAQIEAMLGSSTRFKDIPVTDLGRLFYTHAIDQFFPVKQLQREATGKPTRPGEVPLEMDALTLMRRVPGSTGMAAQFLEGDGAVRFDTHEVVGPSLKEILAPIYDQFEAWERYAISRRVLERDAAGYETGFDPEAAEAVVERYNDEPGFAEAFEGVQKWREHILQYLVDAGALTRRAKRAILAHSNEYVPMFTAPGAKEGISASGTGSGIGDLGSGIKRFFGSGEQKMRPISALIQDTYRLIELAHRQAASNALYQLSQAEGIGWKIEQVATPIEGTPIPVREAIENIMPILGDAQARGVMTEEQVEETAESLAELPAPVLNELMMIYRPGDYFGERNVISIVTRGGKRKWFELEDETLYNAVMDIEHGKPRSRTGKLAFELAGMPALARSLRLGATVLSPVFQVRNPQRDMILSFIQSRHGQVPIVDQVKAATSWLNKDEWYWRWMRGGGPTVALIDMDRDVMRENIQRFMEGGGRLKYALHHPVQMGRAFSAMMENLSRLGEFMRAYEDFKAQNMEGIDEAVSQLRGRMLEQGATEKEADAMAAQARERFEAMARRDSEVQGAVDSRDVAIDFARHGMSTFALRQMAAFWNANLQGHDKMIRSFKEQPLTFSIKAFAGITMPTLAAFAANYDDPDYWRLPQWVRDMYWLIKIPDWMQDSIFDYLPGLMVGEEGEGVERLVARAAESGDSMYLKIAKPHLPGIVFGSVIERFLGFMLTEDPEGLKNTLSEMRDREIYGLIPVPTGAEPLLENMTNRDFFFGSNVVPPGLEDVEERYQYDESTSLVSRQMGDLLNMSPAQLDNLAYGWGGSVARGMLQAADVPLRALMDEPTRPAAEAADIPFVGSMVTEKVPWFTSNIERFYDEMSRLRQPYATWTRFLSRGDFEKAKDYQRDNAREIAQYQLYRSVADILSQTANVTEMANRQDMSPQEKLVFMRRIAAARDRLAKLAIGRRYPEAAERELERRRGGVQEQIQRLEGMIEN